MYHYDAGTALDELREESLLPNPVHVRDMILRTAHSPEEALALNRAFLAYQRAFAGARELAGKLLEELAGAANRPQTM